MLVQKLTVTDLKLVASAHNLFVHSKDKQATIQSTILHHNCNDCLRYVSCFKAVAQVDEQITISKQRSSVLNAVKKYQSNNLEKCKHANLLAVQKGKVKNPEKYKHVNLLAVKKKKKENPEKYKQVNLHAVQKKKNSKSRKIQASQSACCTKEKN
jgi:hypothetical protein